MGTRITSLPPLTRQDLVGRLDGFLIERLARDQDSFEQRQFHPQLVWNRFDLAIKVFYARTLGPDQPALARQLYDAHIHAFSLGDMSEPGNDEKNRIELFHDRFVQMVRRFRQSGFDPAESLVPLASDGTIMNGAHRCASSMLHAIPVTGVMTGLEPFTFDYKYFRSRGMSDQLLDVAALKYIEASPRSRIALIWPSAHDRDNELRQILGPLVYHKKVCLNHNGAFNFLSQVYSNEPWLGSAAEGFPGLRVKLAGCFASRRALRVVLFDHDPNRDLVAIKEQIRSLFDLGKHSIHMTDTHDEAVSIAKLVLNDNSIAFMNQAAPFGLCGSLMLKRQFLDYLRRHDADPEAVLLDGGFVLAAHGLRPAQQIGFMSHLDLKTEGQISRHDADHYPVSLTDMLADPACHFHFWGLKFVTPQLLSQMKAARCKGRDAEDLRLLAPLLHQGRLRQCRQQMVYRMRITVSRLRRSLIRLLDRMGLKRQARRFYIALRRPGP